MPVGGWGWEPKRGGSLRATHREWTWAVSALRAESFCWQQLNTPTKWPSEWCGQCVSITHVKHGVSRVQDAIRCSIRISNVNTCSNALPHQNLYRQTLICQELIVGCNLGVNHICNKLLNSWVLPWVQIIKKAKYVKLFAKLSKLFWFFDVAYCEYLYYKILLLKTCHSKGSLEYE